MNPSATNILYADTTFIDKYKLGIDLDDKDVYFSGDCIKGSIRIPYYADLHCNSRMDIHLTCTFRPSDGGGGGKTRLFKVLVTPCLVVAPNIEYVPFSIPIPNDIPSTVKDKTLPGTMTYKLKVTHELLDLPVSLYPTASIDIRILALIATNDPAYQSPISNEKELKAIPNNDTTGKNKAAAATTNKPDSTNRVHCRLSIPTSCFLEGQNIPILIFVQHVAPVKQMQGIQLQLERITNITTTETGERSVETNVISEVILPLICDVDDHSSTVNSHLTVPAHTPPTLQTNISPLHISYRIKAIINVDINNLLDDTTAPPHRKRDIAKVMVNSWGKRIGWTVDGSSTGILPGSIVELELPITIGTTRHHSMTAKDTTITSSSSLSSSSALSIHSLSNDSQSSLSIISATPSCPPKLPVRPASISNQSASSPNLYSTQLASSSIGDNNSNNCHWTRPTIHKTIRSITDPFSLANYHPYGTAEQQPSAPELGEIEQLDVKNRNSIPSHHHYHGRSKSTPPQDMEKCALYMANS